MLTVEFLVEGGEVWNPIAVSGDEVSDAVHVADWWLKNPKITKALQDERRGVIGYVVRDRERTAVYDSLESGMGREPSA